MDGLQDRNGVGVEASGEVEEAVLGSDEETTSATAGSRAALVQVAFTPAGTTLQPKARAARRLPWAAIRPSRARLWGGPAPGSIPPRSARPAPRASRRGHASPDIAGAW